MPSDPPTQDLARLDNAFPNTEVTRGYDGDEADRGALEEDSPDAQRVTRSQATSDARVLLRGLRNGVLGTLSKRAEGAPFGSVVPYALDRTGAPLVYIAGIAEHTRNLRVDPRVSLLVHEPVDHEEDIQTKARLCILGTAQPVLPDALPDAWARYRARLPAAQGYRQTHDFSLWRIEADRFRWIGGFGEIFWLRPEDFRIDPTNDELRDTSQAIVEHMNEDHMDAILDFYRAERGTAPEQAHMVGIDVYGMDFESPNDERLRVDFPQPTSRATIRMDVIKVLKRVRAKLEG